MNPYEQNARHRKAVRLADAATPLRITADDVANSEGARAMLLFHVDAKSASEATWQLVISSLVARERSR